MSVWFVLPSARPVNEAAPVIAQWKAQGYRIALWRNDDAYHADFGLEGGDHSDKVVSPGYYPGYATVVNELAKIVLKDDPECDWIVCAGDDTLPDPNKRADEIAAECSKYFRYKTPPPEGLQADQQYDWRVAHKTFGVMQPTGDPWEDSHPGEKRLIRRVAGSPWLGRAWCERANQGKGPLWPEYTHQFVDEELQNVAIKLGVFWQREDLTHLHQHWGRPKPGELMGHSRNMPEFLKEANSEEHWNKFKALFESRKAAGFPGHEPL